MDVNDRLYDESRLVDYLKRASTEDMEKFVAGLLNSVEAFAGEADQSDDITIMALRLNAEIAA